MAEKLFTHSQPDLFGGTSFYPINFENVSTHTEDVKALKNAIPNQLIPDNKIHEMLVQFDRTHDYSPHSSEINSLLGQHRSDLYTLIGQERASQGKFAL